MTFKKLWKRICCLVHDDRTRLHDEESVEDWEETQRKRREIEAEKQRKKTSSSPLGLFVTSISMPDGSKEFCLPFSFCFGIHTARQDTKIPKHSLVTTKRRRKTTLVFRVSMRSAARYIT